MSSSYKHSIMRRYTLLLAIFLSLGSLYGCSGTKNFKTEPVLYDRDFEVHHRVHHEKGDTMAIALSANSEDFRLEVVAYSDPNKRIVLNEKRTNVRGRENVPFILKMKVRGDNYFLDVVLRDNDDGRVYRDAFFVDKTDPNTFIRIAKEGKPLIKSYLGLQDAISIYHPDKSQLYIRYYPRTYKPAAPPFSTRGQKFNPRKDFAQMVAIPSGGDVVLEGVGLYFIQADTLRKNGVFINVFEEDFPRIKSPIPMILSTRYITTKAEIAGMLGAESQKNAVDEFWLNRSPNKNFAKELIKTYYTRVQVSNREFTTYKEGWKTDRGMIYVVFGKPDEVLKARGKEVWIYDQTRNRTSMRFEFRKVDGQTLLNRNAYLKRGWDMEVYDWRRGVMN